ncbi:MAG: PadR family transcriptional regulator [Chloroflexi bacterium]|nr:PadR family transcriptional regulator [Chloroflexota bacterium]
MILGLLASHGPSHGHQLRRTAEQTDVGKWGGVNVGALYRELGQLEKEGLIEPLRTEQVGKRPERTVYSITEAGRQEFGRLREQAIGELHFGVDPFQVALLFGRTEDRAELQRLLDKRKQVIEATIGYIKAESAELEEAQRIGPLDVALFRRRIMQLETELSWHSELDRLLNPSA